MSTADPMTVAEETFQAAVDGTASLDDAKAAFSSVSMFKPVGMFDPDTFADQDPIDKLYSEAVNCFKMAIDALEGDQFILARSYVKVARLKLAKARAGSSDSD